MFLYCFIHGSNFLMAQLFVISAKRLWERDQNENPLIITYHNIVFHD